MVVTLQINRVRLKQKWIVKFLLNHLEQVLLSMFYSIKKCFPFPQEKISKRQPMLQQFYILYPCYLTDVRNFNNLVNRHSGFFKFNSDELDQLV